MNFKLKSGDVCKLNEDVAGFYKKNDFKAGLYRVRMIWLPQKSYIFQRIKKDGTVYKSFSNDFDCLTWDRMITNGKVEIV